MIRVAGESSDEDDEFREYLSDDDSAVKNRALEHRQAPEVDIQAQTVNSLFTSILNGNLDTVISILDEGFDVNVKLKDNWTPLMLSASVGNPDVTKELLKRGADVETHKDFYTALMAASSCPEYTSPFDKSLEVAKELINHGADVNAKTRKRMTALMYAASNGNPGIIEHLLPICDRNAEDNQGWNALFWAVNDNKPEVVKILLDAGLEYEKFDVRGNTPFHYAQLNDFEDVVDMLPSREKETRKNGIAQAMYSIDELFEHDRPTFSRDVSVMLYGMKSERNCELFQTNNCDLFKFLTITDEDLLNMGITMPYERYRIQNGLYRFHKHMYKTKSVPIILRDAPYSTIDVLSSITVACRQLIVMEASLKYLLQNVETIEELQDLKKEIEQIKTKLGSVKKTASAIYTRAKRVSDKSYMYSNVLCFVKRSRSE